MPHTWLEYFEQKLGRAIEYVSVEVNENLKIAPYYPREDNEKLDIVDFVDEVIEVSGG